MPSILYLLECVVILNLEEQKSFMTVSSKTKRELDADGFAIPPVPLKKQKKEVSNTILDVFRENIVNIFSRYNHEIPLQGNLLLQVSFSRLTGKLSEQPKALIVCKVNFVYNKAFEIEFDLSSSTHSKFGISERTTHIILLTELVLNNLVKIDEKSSNKAIYSASELNDLVKNESKLTNLLDQAKKPENVSRLKKDPSH